MATIVLTNESGTPSTPSAGVTKVYARGGILHLLDSTGASHPVNSSGISAGPTGSGATFTGSTAIADAIAAAMALTPTVVDVLPGQYTENVTLPAGVSLVAANGTAQLIGSITLNGTASSLQTVSGFMCGNVYLNAGATSSAMVILHQCQIQGDDTDAAVMISDNGWQLVIEDCRVDGVSRKAVLGLTNSIRASGSSFETSGTSAVKCSGSVTAQQCGFTGNVTIGGASASKLIDSNFQMSGSAPFVFYLGGTAQLRLMGSFSVSGVNSSTGTLWTGTGSFSAHAGTFLGAYNSGHMPAVDSGSEGAIAYALDTHSLAVVASGVWAPVGSGGGGIPDPGSETPGAMLYFRDPGGGGTWELVQHSRDGSSLKFNLYSNNGAPYWEYPQTPEGFTLHYESAAVVGVDPYNVPGNPGGSLPLPVTIWSASMVGGGTALTAPGGSEPTWSATRSVVFTTGKVVSGTPTVLEAPSGGAARTLCVVLDNALGVGPGTNIVSYGNGWTTLSPAGEGFGIVVLANGNLGFSSGGGPANEVDFAFLAASNNRRLIMVAYDGAGIVRWSINGGSWSLGTPMVLNTGGGGGSVATPFIIGGTGASYGIQNVTVYNTDLHNNQGVVNQFLSYCANALSMVNGATMTFPGGELSSGTLFYYGGGQGLTTLGPGVPGNVLTVGLSGSPEWDVIPATPATLTNGALASRTAGTVGQQFLVADEGGPSHGDMYVCAQASRWELVGYNRTYYPHSPTRYWTLTSTAAGPTFPNSGSLGGAEDLNIVGGVNPNVPAGFGSIASRRTRFTGTAGASGGTPPTSTGAVTLAVWYKPTANTGTVTPILACVDSDTAPTKGMGIWQDTVVGSIIITANNQTVTLPVPTEILNQDSLLVLTWDKDHVAHTPNELNLFVNGTGIGGISMGGPTLLDWTSCSWVIGNFGVSPLNVAGELCQAACFDGTILSDSEIQEMYERGVGTYTGH